MKEKKILTELKNKEKKIISENKTNLTTENTIEDPEKVIEKIEPILEEIEKISSDIEEKSDEILENSQNFSLFKKNQNIVEELYSKSESFLKRISQKLANYPKEVSYSFRDKRLAIRAEYIYEKIRKNKVIGDYKNNNVSKEKEVKANLAFDNILRSVENLLQTIKSDNWGYSKKNKEKVRMEVASFLGILIDTSILLKRNKEMFEVLTTYEGLVKYTNCEYLKDKLSSVESYIFKKETDPETDSYNFNDFEKTKESFNNDPFLLCTHISNRSSNYKKSKSILKEQIDKIIEKYPNIKSFPFEHLLQDSINNFPEEYINDPDKLGCVYEVFKNTGINYSPSALKRESHFFLKELKDFSPEDSKKIIEKISSYDFQQIKNQILITSLPVFSEDNQKQLYEKCESYMNLSHGASIENNEELLKYIVKNSEQHQNMKTLLIIPFLRPKEFNLNKDDKILFFKNIISRDMVYFNNNESVSFLVKIAENYNEIFENISLEEIENEMSLLIKAALSNNGNENYFKLKAFFEYYNMPIIYKEKLEDSFVTECGISTLQKLFLDNYGETFNQEALLKNEPALLKKLEVEFYKRGGGGMNDLRHLFFDVIEGKKQVGNKDELILSYVKNLHFIESEEFIDLFLIRKKVDKNYVSLFIKKIENESNFFLQIEEKLRLDQITQEEYNWIVKEAVQNGTNSCAAIALDICLDNSGLTNKEKIDLTNEYIINFVNNISKNQRNNGDDYSQFISSKIINKFNHRELIEKREILSKITFEQLLSHENLHESLANLIKRGLLMIGAFPDKEIRKENLERVLESGNIPAVKSLLGGYLGLDEDNLKIHSSFSLLNEEDRSKFFKHALSLDNVNIDIECLGLIPFLSSEEKDLLIERIIARDDVFSGTESYNQQIDFCTRVILHTDFISDKVDKIFDKIFSSTELNSNILLSLVRNNKDFLISHPEIFDKFINKCLSIRNINPMEVLEGFKSVEQAVFSQDQIKKLSIKVLENGYLNNTAYQMYLDNKPEILSFYLDQSLFDENIDRMIKATYYGTNNDSEILDFLYLQRRNKNNQEKKIICSFEQEKQLCKRLFLKIDYSLENIEKQIDSFDSNIFNQILDESLSENQMDDNLFMRLLENDEHILKKEFSSKIIKYAFESNKINKLSILPFVIKKYGQDQTLLDEIKKYITKFKDPGEKWSFYLILLREDLLTAEELQKVYETARSQEDIRAQVLSSAEILGCLASLNKMDNVKSFFKEKSEQTEKDMEDIVYFVDKNSIQKKGRTIVVMLFAKHYLPDRSPEEIIEKVAIELRKEQRVLDNYNCESIPDGIKTTIGCEIEITSSTKDAYKELTNGDLKTDIVRLSEAAHIGAGCDAVHEIATRPAINPYLMLLEVKLLHDLEYLDINFDRSPLYQKGARGYHLTVGGEKGLSVNANTHFLQNMILAASWGGLHSGETNKRVSGGRGVTLRGRDGNASNNIQMFDKKTSSVELRSLSIDKFEPFQRSIITAYNGAIAIQALEEYTKTTSDNLSQFFEDFKIKDEDDFFIKLETKDLLKNTTISDLKIKKIIYLWAKLSNEIKKAVDYHNEEFLSGETTGYLDKDEIWVDTDDFGGQYNKARFEAVVTSIDSTLSIEEYVNTTKIAFNDLFSSFDVELANSFTKINNLYLKPTEKVEIEKPETKKEKEEREKNNQKRKKIVLLQGGDQANSMSFFKTTKLDNETLERRDEDIYLQGTVFDTLGEEREGYYNIQGASERMLTHAVQKALLSFNKKMEVLVNKR